MPELSGAAQPAHAEIDDKFQGVLIDVDDRAVDIRVTRHLRARALVVLT